MKSHTGKGDKTRDGGGTLEGQQKASELDREDLQLPAPQASPSASDDSSDPPCGLQEDKVQSLGRVTHSTLLFEYSHLTCPTTSWAWQRERKEIILLGAGGI